MSSRIEESKRAFEARLRDQGLSDGKAFAEEFAEYEELWRLQSVSREKDEGSEEDEWTQQEIGCCFQNADAFDGSVEKEIAEHPAYLSAWVEGALSVVPD